MNENASSNFEFSRLFVRFEVLKVTNLQIRPSYPVSSSSLPAEHRDGRGLGSTLLQIGKLTLQNLLPLATGGTIGQASNSASTSEKISSGNSVEIALPSSTDPPSSSSSSVRPCTTPDGGRGQCRDLANCPALLLQLDSLRKSICFQSLFVPGVCCPDAKNNNAIVSIINQLASSNVLNNRPVESPKTTTNRPTTIDYNSFTSSPVTLAPTTSRPLQTFLNPIINSGSQSQVVQAKGTFFSAGYSY